MRVEESSPSRKRGKRRVVLVVVATEAPPLAAPLLLVARQVAWRDDWSSTGDGEAPFACRCRFAHAHPKRRAPEQQKRGLGVCCMCCEVLLGGVRFLVCVFWVAEGACARGVLCCGCRRCAGLHQLAHSETLRRPPSGGAAAGRHKARRPANMCRRERQRHKHTCAVEVKLPPEADARRVVLVVVRRRRRRRRPPPAALLLPGRLYKVASNPATLAAAAATAGGAFA